MVTPGEPQRGERQKAQEVDIELPRPAHRRDIPEENGEQAKAVIGDDKSRVPSNPDKQDN